MTANPGEGEEPQVLHVKRGAVVLDEGPLRDGPFVPPPGGRPRNPAALSAPRTGRGASRRPGRWGRLALLVALALAAVALLFVFGIQSRAGVASLSGYRVTLRAVPVDGLLAASVSLAREAGSREEDGTVSVRFSLPDTGAEAAAEQPLSAAVIVAARLPFTGKEKSVTASVRIGGSVCELSLGLGRQLRKP